MTGEMVVLLFEAVIDFIKEQLEKIKEKKEAQK
jgi:hypothetical protein